MSDDADLSERLRTVAGQILSDDALDSFVKYAVIDAYTTETGGIDEEKVIGHLTAIHAASMPRTPPRNWGQHSGPGGPSTQPGDQARRALAKRHGVGADNGEPAAGQGVRRGDTAREALARRHGVKR
jgi:hypothetical protein